MVPSNDIPIALINLALLAVVSLPVIVVCCAVYIAHKSVRPGWATYHMLKRWEEEQKSSAPHIVKSAVAR